MDLLITLVIVLVAAAWLGRRLLRTLLPSLSRPGVSEACRVCSGCELTNRNDIDRIDAAQAQASRRES